jgi:hypothetical protein
LTPHPESMDTGFAEYIKTLPDHIQWLLIYIKFVPGSKLMLKQQDTEVW